jgi:hypothetical protein
MGTLADELMELQAMRDALDADNDERVDLCIFLGGLPERARGDKRAVAELAQLYADAFDLPASHVVRRIGRGGMQ